MSAPPAAFVAGATGYTGRSVVAELRRRGVATVAHLRPDSRDRARWTERFASSGASVDLTPWDAAALRDTLVRLRPTVVFALLGTTRARAGKEGIDDPYERIDFGLTEMLRTAAIGAGHQLRFVYLSAYGATERTTNKYLAVRGRMERLLHDGTLPFLIAQPLFITGPDREESRAAERIGAAVLDSVLRAAAWMGAARLRERFASMTGGELARALVTLALEDQAARRVADAVTLRRAAGSALTEGAAP